MNNDSEILKRALDRERKARKQAEILLEDKARDLYISNQELLGSIEELKKAQLHLVQSEKMASVGLLAAGVAHEINNPIAFVSSNLETLAEYTNDLAQVIQKQTQFLQHLPKDSDDLRLLLNYQKDMDIEFVTKDLGSLIHESIEGLGRVKKIVNDLSEFSHLSREEYSEENIHEIIDKAINISWNQIKYKVELDTHYEKLPLIKCKAGKLGQVFLNLIINASHAIENKGKLSIYTELCEERDRKDWIVITFIDTGSGIDPQDISKIFDPFFTTKDVGQGTGLGLHIVGDVVSNHGGTITVESELGVGTCFSIHLPIAGKNA